MSGEVAHPGAALYERYCALCHAEDGSGYAADHAPRLANEGLLSSATDAYLRRAIADGRPGTPMSAWSRQHGGPLTDRQIHQLVSFLRTWQEGPAVEVDEGPFHGDAERGAPVYREHCASCHGEEGQGVDAPALANPVFRASASPGFIRHAILHGRPGTPMRAFRGVLEDGRIDDVLAFVQTLGAEADPPAAAREAPAELDVPRLEDMVLVHHPDGPTPRFNVRADRYVPVAEVAAAHRRGAKMVILDARATSDWLRGRIPGAVPVPFYELGRIIEGLPRDGTWMIAYCGCPHAASGRVVDALRAAGFTNAVVLDEGIHHWETEGHPMASGPEQP